MPQKCADDFEFRPLNGQHQLDEKMTLTYEQPSQSTKKNGCHISYKRGLLLVIIAVILVVSVAIIVYFASRTSNCDGLLEPGSSSMWTSCESMSAAKNECLHLPPHCMSPKEIEPPTPAPVLEDIFLPTCLKPYHYNLLIWPWIYAAPGQPEADPNTFHNRGEVEMFVECIHATDVIILHTRGLDVNNTSIHLATVEPTGETAPQWVDHSQDFDREFFKVHLDAKLTPGHKYMLRLAWTADIDDSLMGFYRSSYEMNGQTHWLAATQFQATEARKTFPCMDEPALKATFNISLKRLESFHTLSNMNIREMSEPEVHEMGTFVTDHYHTTVKMPTYLLAFMFSQFLSKSANTSSGVLVRVWARPNAINQVDYALGIAVRILEHFESYFNISYPLPKQDMVALPDFSAGAMENWGLINYRETALLYEEGVSTVYNRQRIAVVVSHELAHQWFGNLVTMQWWDDLWLNEGFASYVEYLGVDYVEPEWDMKSLFLVEDLHRVFGSDSLTTSHPIFVRVKNPNQIREIFDSISYAKGASLIRMMTSFLGEETFAQGLTNYLNENAYGNANHSDLWNALDAQARRNNIELDIRAIMDTWILQMGYPVVTLTRRSDDPTVIQATQNYFRLDNDKPISTKFTTEFGYTWVIPLTFLTSTSPMTQWTRPSTTWMNRGNVSISGVSDQGWVLGNVKQMGYYRVNYDLDNWERLITQLQSDHRIIHTHNRAQIIDDSFNLGRAGTIDTLVFMKASVYMDQEDEYVVWKSFFRSMTYVDLMLTTSSMYGNFSTYMNNKMRPLYHQLGWTPVDGHQRRYLQRVVIGSACKLGLDDCVTTAIEKFVEWMAYPDNNQIVPELRSTVYCLGIRNGGFDEWNFVLDKYRTSNVASEKRDFLKALSCSGEAWILNYYIELIQTDRAFRKQDSMAALTYISRNPIGRYIVWNYVRTHWEFILEQWGIGFYALQKTLLAITVSFNTEISIQELDDFIRWNPSLGPVKRTLNQIVEETSSNIQWMSHNENKIGVWLAETLA